MSQWSEQVIVLAQSLCLQRRSIPSMVRIVNAFYQQQARIWLKNLLLFGAAVLQHTCKTHDTIGPLVWRPAPAPWAPEPQTCPIRLREMAKSHTEAGASTDRLESANTAAYHFTL
jgi:hypothetical protein